MTKQQLQNNIEAAAQERINIADLEKQLATTRDVNVKKVLRYRIKICRDFLRQYIQTAQAIERTLAV